MYIHLGLRSFIYKLDLFNDIRSYVTNPSPLISVLLILRELYKLCPVPLKPNKTPQNTSMITLSTLLSTNKEYYITYIHIGPIRWDWQWLNQSQPTVIHIWRDRASFAIYPYRQTTLPRTPITVYMVPCIWIFLSIYSSSTSHVNRNYSMTWAVMESIHNHSPL